jgi:hypothetical protein
MRSEFRDRDRDRTEGELTRIAYRVGEIRYLPGKIRVEEPIPSARVVKIR